MKLLLLFVVVCAVAAGPALVQQKDNEGLLEKSSGSAGGASGGASSGASGGSAGDVSGGSAGDVSGGSASGDSGASADDDSAAAAGARRGRHGKHGKHGKHHSSSSSSHSSHSHSSSSSSSSSEEHHCKWVPYNGTHCSIIGRHCRLATMPPTYVLCSLAQGRIEELDIANNVV